MGDNSPQGGINNTLRVTTRTRSRRRRRKAEEALDSTENLETRLSSASSKQSDSSMALRPRRRQAEVQPRRRQSSRLRRRQANDDKDESKEPEPKAVYSLSVEEAEDVVFRLSPITEDRPAPLGGQYTVVTTNRREEDDTSSSILDVTPRSTRSRRRRRQLVQRDDSMDSEGMILCVVPLAAASATTAERCVIRHMSVNGRSNRCSNNSRINTNNSRTNNSRINNSNTSNRRNNNANRYVRRFSPMSLVGRRTAQTPDYPTNAILCQIDLDDDNEVMYEVEDVHYEPVSNVRLGKQRLRDWRLFARYELTSNEVLKQEKELYYSFNEIKDPDKNEGVRPTKPGEPACCVCYENAATRVVVPCGHQCLCYQCASNIAMNRTVFYGSRLPKLCPLCQAVIGLIPKLC